MESKKVKNILLATMTLLLVLAGFSKISPAQYNTAAPQAPEIPTTDNPLEVWVYLDNPRIISGKMITLTVQVVWKLGVKVELDALAGIDLSPFEIEQITIGERLVFDNTKDFMVTQYLLSLPDGLKHGEYVIPAFSVPYFNEIDKMAGAASSYPITVRKVPILAKARLDRDIFDIGDRIKYTLTILNEKNVSVLFENLERFNFEPFEVLDTKVHKKTTTGRLESTVIEYSLAIYEIGTEKQQYEIPSIPVIYYIEPDVEHKVYRAEKAALETKEIKTPPVPVFINTLLKAVDIPLEGLKGPVVYAKYHLCKRSHLPAILGIGILVFIGVVELKRSSRRFPTGAKEPTLDTSEIAAERLSRLVSSYRSGEKKYEEKDFVANVDTALRVFLGTLVDIPRETALSLTTSQFANDHLFGKLSRGFAEQAQGTLKHLDLMIFGGTLEETEVEKLLDEVEEVLSASSGTNKG
jgi:hypothetical protein